MTIQICQPPLINDLLDEISEVCSCCLPRYNDKEYTSLPLEEKITYLQDVLNNKSSPCSCKGE